jgi:hypothetical protein
VTAADVAVLLGNQGHRGSYCVHDLMIQGGRSGAARRRRVTRSRCRRSRAYSFAVQERLAIAVLSDATGEVGPEKVPVVGV